MFQQVIFTVRLNLSNNLGLVINNLGFALIITAIVNLFHEIFISKLELIDISKSLSNEIIKNINFNNDRNNGLVLVSKVRRGYDGYYEWVTMKGPFNMFIAGRSVLHRIQSDLNDRCLGKFEDIIIQKLRDESSIKMLLLDPRSDLIERLAIEEEREPKDFYRNLQEAFQTINKLYSLIKDIKFPHKTQFSIRLYDKIPYFAYHQVNDKVILGFYFASGLMHTSSAYKIIDNNTKIQFEKHFESIYDNSIRLMEASSKHHQIQFNIEEFKNIQKVIDSKV